MTTPKNVTAAKLAMVIDLAEKGLTPIILICAPTDADLDSTDQVPLTIASTDQIGEDDIRRIFWQLLDRKNNLETVNIDL